MMSFPKLSAYTISGVNRLDHHAKLDIYSRMIPSEVMERFKIGANFLDSSGNNLLTLECPSGSSSTEMELRHQFDFTDPILYGHITDTINGQIHVLLYILNDPSSPRFDIDHLPDGTYTEFGTRYRNIPAEIASLEFGLAPGQVRRGLRLLRPAIAAFEQFVTSLGQNIYFVEPLFYHNAIIFERYGFAYEKGRRLMERIQVGFSQGDLIEKLGNTNPFRQPGAVTSIRLRSWAIHDGLLGEPFTNVTMYKRIGEPANVSTCQDCSW
jgi:hypothetical protein